MNWKKILVWLGGLCVLMVALFAGASLWAVHSIQKEKNRKKTAPARAARHVKEPEPEEEEEEEPEEEEQAEQKPLPTKTKKALDEAFELMKKEVPKPEADELIEE